MRSHLLPALALCAALVACGGESDEKLLASARGYLEKDDAKAAVIQLKTLLQNNPKSGPGRLMLGKALREGGDAAGAVLELRKAQELGVPDDELLPELARAMLQSGDGARVVGQFAATELKDPKANADLAVTVASAYGLQKDNARALEASNRALRSVPGYAPAVVLQARLKAMGGDIDAALLMVDDVLAKQPGDAAASLLKGELLWHAKGDRDGALALYRKLVAAEPKAIAAHSAIVTVLMEQNHLDEANTALAAMAKVAPSHPDTVFLQARAALLKRDFAAVRDLTARLLKAAPDNGLVLEMAGLAEMGLQSDAQAEALLARAVKAAPGRVLARQALARIYLRQNDAARALATVQPLVDGKQPDGQSLAIAGEAYLQQGDAARADDAFQRAAKAAPEDPRVRTSMAMAQLAKGDTAGAASALESVVASDKTPRADLALIAARVRQNDLPGAMKAVDGLRAKLPDAPLPDLLLGRLQLAKKDSAAARQAFEAAARKDPKYFPAVAHLAALDFAAGKPDAARQRLEALAQADPRSYQARLALAELATRTDGAPSDVSRLIADAVKAAPAEAAPRLLQVNWLMRQNDAKGALVAAQDAASALPDNREVMGALGGAQLAAGDAQQALSTLRKLASLDPKNAAVQMHLADAYLANKDTEGARTSLRRAAELNPELPAPYRGLARLAVADKRFDEALAIARDLQKRQPKAAAGFHLEGDIETARRAWAPATAAFRAALQRERSPEVAMSLHRVLLASGQGAEAERLAADWVKERPKDAVFLYYLGDQALARKDWPEAEKRYRAVLELQPNNGLAMNNIAWLLATTKKPGGVAMAEQALKLLPDASPVLDTLALALAAEGQVPRAIETQKRAIARSPNDPGLKLNLAKLYIQSGDKLQAKGELDGLQKLGDRFGGQAQVAELLKTVQ